ncbi:MAG: cupin domain-containing protein [Actinomycetota bacterium]
MTTEMAPGVYVSSTDADDFALDPEVGGFTHTLRDDDRLQAGIWKAPDDVDAAPFEFPHDETILVLDGEVEIEIEGGPTLHLKPGSIASFSKGVRSTWRPSIGFREFWVYSA